MTGPDAAVRPRTARAVEPAEALTLLTDAVQRLSLAASAEAVQRIVRTAARSLTGADGATFVLRDRDMCFYVEEDAIEPLWKGQRFPLEDCISGWAMLNRRHVVIEDIYADARIPHEAYRPTFVKSLVMVPIRTIDPIGAIGIYWATRHHATDEQIGLARALADSTAITLENVQRIDELDRTRRLAETDPLTGVANRRAWDAAVEKVLGSDDGSVHVLLVDLDHFKLYNDEHGHASGDRLLRECATAWHGAVRGSDVIARIGGEEFGVLLTHASDEQAATIAARIRGAIPDSRTASVGVARWDGAETAERLVARADEALYRAKAAGRDCTVVSS